jgi:hypothetical protein
MCAAVGYIDTVQGMWNPTATQAAGTLWFILAQRCNQSHSNTSSPILSNNQFTTHI